MRPLPPEPDRGTNPFTLLAAAATPVVAAALLAVALVAGGCHDRPATPTTSSSPSPSPSAAASTGPAPATSPGASGSAPGSPGDSAVPGAGRLLVVVGLPARPRAEVRDAGRPATEGRPVALPPGSSPLAAVAVARDGRVAAVAADGRAWVAPAIFADAPPAWARLAGAVPELPGPVLGAAWAAAGDDLVLVAGSPGSGMRRTALVVLPVDGSPPRAVEVPLEADGPGLAALPGGVIAFVGRDLRDRGVLARAAPSGSFVTLSVEARTVASGGDLVALAGDATVVVGTLAALDRGQLPATPLPLEGDAGIGPIAIASDGSAIAVVRLDSAGAAARIDVLRRAGRGLVPAATLGLDPAGGAAIAAWLP